MIERRYGRIINIASLASFVALYEVAAYNASKAGAGRPDPVAGARVGARAACCVNAIAPGVFRTPLNAELIDETRPRARAAASARR